MPKLEKNNLGCPILKASIHGAFYFLLSIEGFFLAHVMSQFTPTCVVNSGSPIKGK